MVLTSDNKFKNIFEAIESDIGIPKGFLHNFSKGDDWSFIIKLHALLEASFTNILITKFNNRKINDQIGWLSLSDNKIGKLKFARNLGLINKDDYNFVILLSRLRNKLVHNICNINFSLKEYIDILDKNQKKSFEKKVFRILPEELISLLSNKQKDIAYAPKQYIWTASIFILAKNYGSKAAIKYFNPSGKST